MPPAASRRTTGYGEHLRFTYHARMSQDELESLKVLLATAGYTYLMSLPVGDDIMLNYQSTSYHDIPSVRRLTGRRPTPEFDAWLSEMGNGLECLGVSRAVAPPPLAASACRNRSKILSAPTPDALPRRSDPNQNCHRDHPSSAGIYGADRRSDLPPSEP